METEFNHFEVNETKLGDGNKEEPKSLDEMLINEEKAKKVNDDDDNIKPGHNRLRSPSFNVKFVIAVKSI